MSVGSEKYCFDTNCFIEPWNKFYSYKSHRSYWEDFVVLEIGNGSVVVLKEVYDELGRKDDDLFKWLRKYRAKNDNMVTDADVSLVLQVRDLLEKYPRLVGNDRGRSIADPFLIEYARKK